VKRLIHTQFPEWAELPVVPVENGGWDNRTFRLGDKMSVRLPSASAYPLRLQRNTVGFRHSSHICPYRSWFRLVLALRHPVTHGRGPSTAGSTASLRASIVSVISVAFPWILPIF
jgi:hypothetical protein